VTESGRLRNAGGTVMARRRRSEQIPADEVGVYHCIQRAVRRLFLLGDSAAPGASPGHRKAWVTERLEALAGGFAVEVGGFAVLSNHLHVIRRNRPDLAASWDDEEVARR
jgi:hypothetical protein